MYTKEKGEKMGRQIKKRGREKKKRQIKGRQVEGISPGEYRRKSKDKNIVAP